MNYNEKKEEIMKKYEKLIYGVAEAEEMDIGVAFDMVLRNVEAGTNYGFRKMAEDVSELNEIARKQVNGELAEEAPVEE